MNQYMRRMKDTLVNIKYIAQARKVDAPDGLGGMLYQIQITWGIETSSELPTVTTHDFDDAESRNMAYAGLLK